MTDMILKLTPMKNIPITPEFLFVPKLGQGTFISDFNSGCI